MTIKYWIDKNILYKYQHKKWFWKFFGKSLFIIQKPYMFQIAHKDRLFMYPYLYDKVVRDDYYLTLQFCEEMYNKYLKDKYLLEMAIFTTKGLSADKELNYICNQ